MRDQGKPTDTAEQPDRPNLRLLLELFERRGILVAATPPRPHDARDDPNDDDRPAERNRR